MKKLIRKINIFNDIGVLISLISIYWLIYSFIDLINFSKIGGGLQENEFGTPDDLYRILIKNFFWIIQLIGGIGLIKSNNLGLKIGLVSISLSTIYVMGYTLVIFIEKLGYSPYTLVNGKKRLMNFNEKWELIYSEPINGFLILITLIIVLFLISKRLTINKPAYNNG